MYTQQKQYERKTEHRQQNMCPIHATKLQTAYYDDLDLLVTKCREKDCTEGHSMTEQFKARKDRKKQAWLKKNAHKLVEDTIEVIESEELETEPA